MSRRRLLLVEDEALIAMLLEDMLADLGYDIVGMVANVAEAVELAQACECDGAILDVNVNGESVYPVATILRDRGIPFLFASGYGARGLPDEFRGSPVLQKPFQQDALAAKLAGLFAAAQPAAKTAN
jgi:CheY-like chemotaxis protein